MSFGETNLDFNLIPAHALGPLGIVFVVRDVGPRQLVDGHDADAVHVRGISAYAPVLGARTVAVATVWI